MRNAAGTEIGTAASPIRVDPTGTTTQPVSAVSLPLPTGAATLAEQQTQTTALQIMDDWDESDRAKVNPIVGQAGVQGGSGTVSATTQRVVLATDVALPPSALEGKTFVTKTFDWTTAQTEQDVWDPAASNKFVITDIVLNCSAACTVTLFDETDSTTNRVFKGSFAQYGGLVMNYAKPRESAAVNNVLQITTSAGSGFITVTGYETT